MAFIVYYTKLGCMTSEKQVTLLRQSGHEVEVHDLLVHPWLPQELTSYFGSMPVQLWFNPNSPRIKSGEIDPSAYTCAEALSLMLEDHLLIRRPLMESGGQRMCGFDPAQVHVWVRLASPEEVIADSTNFQVCSQKSSATKGDSSYEKCN